MHVTFAKGIVGVGSSAGIVAMSVVQLYEPAKLIGVCLACLVSLLTAISIGLDIARKWRNRNT